MHWMMDSCSMHLGIDIRVIGGFLGTNQNQKSAEGVKMVVDLVFLPTGIFQFLKKNSLHVKAINAANFPSSFKFFLQ